MQIKRVNIGYLCLIILVILVNMIPALGQTISDAGLVVNIAVSEGIVLLPLLILVLTGGEKLSQLFPFHRIRFTTILWILLFTILIFPLSAFLNSFSMLFTENRVLQMSDDIVSASPVVMFLCMAVFAPMCEELAFRGIVFGTYRKGGNILKAVLLSALLFGFMHMNFNQAIYAFAIGIFMALLVEATGSIWSSFLFHLIFNSNAVITLFGSKASFGEEGLEEAASAALSSGNTLLIVIAFYGVVSVFTTFLAVKVLRKIGKNEGREDFLGRIWEERKIPARLFTIPLVAALVLAFGFMTYVMLMTP